MSTISVKNERASKNGLLMLITFVAVAILAVAAFFALPALNRGVGSGSQSPLALWEAQGIENYRFTLERNCFCLTEATRPTVIQVRDGKAVAFTYADDGTSADPLYFQNYSTVEELFAVLEQAQAENPVRFDVTYDTETGIPTDVAIDISEMMADEEIFFTVTNFEALP